jgi:methionine synthase II (cobalamin-independent)
MVLLRIDEPLLAGCPEEVGVTVEVINSVTTGVDTTWGRPVCYGNRYTRLDKLISNPDCGLCHLPAYIARSKLAAMVEGTMAVRRTVAIQSGTRTVTSPEPTVEQGV